LITINLSIAKIFSFDLTPELHLTFQRIVRAKPISARNSAAVEDYLERILELMNSKGYARVVDIAAALKISQASVTNMVQRLDADGLLKYEKYRGLVLTNAGEKLARSIAHRHKLLTDFLKLLGLNDRVIYHDVEGMEHHISPSTLRAIEALVRQLRQRPAFRARLRPLTR
jgi:Mn-dependent DtxR family transcriptional regulator